MFGPLEKHRARKLRRMIDAGLIERMEPLHSPRQRYRLSS